ncbi:MAG: hypothetical protein R3359_06860 [Marinirhabdus sp.]|nr:hypothetical protein [Marinirhabdus sp.]
MYKTILLLLLAISSCGTPKSTDSKEPPSTNTSETAIENGTFSIQLGDQITSGNLILHFKEVLEDSRCPTGTTCIWQGRAKLLVEVSEAGQETRQSEIIFGELHSGEQKNHVFFQNDRQTVTAIAIRPYPTEASGTTGLPYELDVEITIQ